MISYDNETIPPKEDKVATSISNDVAIVETTNLETQQVVATENSDGAQSSSCTTTTDSTVPAATTSNNRRFNIQFQQRTKYIRELWSQQRIRINKDYSQFFLIIFVCVLSIVASFASLTTNNWTCDPNSNRFFGLWNTCQGIAQIRPINNSTIINRNETISEPVNNKIQCVKQELRGSINFEFSEQTRIDQIYASQGMIISGIVLYIFAVICFLMGYKFLKANSMNYLRNALIITVFVQIIAFWLLLFGFFLFIYTDRFSISVVLLFVYFGLAIFATNIINFITIEYKSYKMRQVTI